MGAGGNCFLVWAVGFFGVVCFLVGFPDFVIGLVVGFLFGLV